MRFLLLFLFAAFPLLAGAHEGEHQGHRAASEPHGASVPSAERPATPSGVAARAVAPSRCPGGGHEACCCHEFTGTPSYQPVAIADAGRCELNPALPDAEIARDTQSAPRSIAFARYSPRGPPPYS
jgi:hypothetical protein